jgi:hypothetical protein
MFADCFAIWLVGLLYFVLPGMSHNPDFWGWGKSNPAPDEKT